MKTFLAVAMIGLMGSGLARASKSGRAINISVKFDRTFYTLKYDSHTFNYAQGSLLFHIKTKPCNRKQLDKIAGAYRKLLKKYPSDRFAKMKGVDVTLVSSNKKYNIARGSQFGTWLRTLPAKMIYYNAEAKVSCRR